MDFAGSLGTTIGANSDFLDLDLAVTFLVIPIFTPNKAENSNVGASATTLIIRKSMNHKLIYFILGLYAGD